MTRVLGVSAGAPDGSAEILLTAALMEAEALGSEVALLRLQDMRIPSGPFAGGEPDDCPWFFDQVMDSDGIIYSAPIYSRTVPGRLRLLVDRAFGPSADVGLLRLMQERERSGQPLGLPFRPDERILRTRVTAFIAVGGALTAQWRTLALPLMHALAFSMRDPVVDQVCFGGAGTPRSIVLDTAALERARRLGANVAAQLGREFEAAEYLGEPGLCPLCHLNLIEVRGDAVECGSCGAEGRLSLDGGRVSVHFEPEGLAKSVISLEEKQAHSLEIMETAARHAGQSERIAEVAAPYVGWDRLIRPASPADAAAPR